MSPQQHAPSRMRAVLLAAAALAAAIGVAAVAKSIDLFGRTSGMDATTAVAFVAACVGSFGCAAASWRVARGYLPGQTPRWVVVVALVALSLLFAGVEVSIANLAATS